MCGAGREVPRVVVPPPILVIQPEWMKSCLPLNHISVPSFSTFHRRLRF